jgi:hypothetical protein
MFKVAVTGEVILIGVTLNQQWGKFRGRFLWRTAT